MKTHKPTRAIKALLAVAALVAVSVGQVRAAELTIAAAANVKFALDDVVTAFHQHQTNIQVKLTYGSSGNFFAQIQNRAPFDLFLSADVDYPRKLADAGLALDTNVFLYAAGRLVIWVPTNSPVDVQKLGIQSLLHPSVKKISIANPKHAPYGAAAMAAMKKLGVYEQAESRLVFGENIAQAAQFAESGAADIGIIALSLALSLQMRNAGHFWEIPTDTYPRLEQGGIILEWTRDAAAARTFRDFLLGEQGRAVLNRYGYFLPEK